MEQVIKLDEFARQGEIMFMGDKVFISGFGRYVKEYTCKNKAKDSGFKCSKCNYSFISSNLNYCPNCGAKVINNE